MTALLPAEAKASPVETRSGPGDGRPSDVSVARQRGERIRWWLRSTLVKPADWITPATSRSQEQQHTCRGMSMRFTATKRGR
jgi:hypothetical protein